MSYIVGDIKRVLDKGYIKLVDIMGSDEDICVAARVSYHEGSTKKVQQDKGLIDHLLRHRHTSPFEMGEMKFEIKLPIFVERQWVRHRTCSMNEMSGRYSEMPEEYYIPEEDAVRVQSTTNKQGRGEASEKRLIENFRSDIKAGAGSAFTMYHAHLQDDIARELARINLPISTYTKKVWKMDLHNLFHFLKLRTDAYAQWEIRQYAEEIEKFVEQAFPWSYASWKNHVKDAVTFSADEWHIIKGCLNTADGDPSMLDEIPDLIKNSKLSKARRRELKQKLGV